MDKKALSERDICTKCITPALEKAGWDKMAQIREEVTFTAGRVLVRGKLVARGKAKRADYILYYKPNIPIALIEAKDNNHSVGGGMQQALVYSEILDIPFVYSSNGDAFLEHDRTDAASKPEKELNLNAFGIHQSRRIPVTGGDIIGYRDKSATHGQSTAAHTRGQELTGVFFKSVRPGTGQSSHNQEEY